MDADFLRDRAFHSIRQATLFPVDYMKRPDGHGPQWNDDRYHIIPSVPPELYGLKPGFDFMAPMGMWFENFALPLVVNECLMQSYDRTIRFYPNWDKSKDAEFSTLRAVGAFLISSRLAGENVELTSVH
jgi:hypothetical protein